MKDMIQKCKMKNLTWLRVGGEVNFIQANTISDLNYAIDHAKKNQMKIFIIGAGSNTLAMDELKNILVIKLGGNFNFVEIENNKITAGCSLLSKNLSNFALKNSKTGLEFLSTIPGTVGGAIAMNSGAYGHDISMHIKHVKIIDMHGKIDTISAKEMGYVYRGNSLKNHLIFLEAIFQVENGNYENIKEKMNIFNAKKIISQPTKAKTCGSLFKNVGKVSAWKLIDDSGCRGMNIGDAMISKQHSNFLINNGSCNATEIELLYKEVQKKVKNCFNYDLELEVVLLQN